MAEALEPDLVLLDIAMPGLDGIEVARALSRSGQSPAVVFVTAFDQFAVAAFDVAAIDYLMKPVDADAAGPLDRPGPRLSRSPGPSARRTKRRPRRRRHGSRNSGRRTCRAWSASPRATSTGSPPSAIICGSTSAKRSWLIHHSMAALEEGLDPELFVRLHRSAIVRRDFIAGFSRNASGRWIARLADGNEQPVGRLYADQVRAIAGR